MKVLHATLVALALATSAGLGVRAQEPQAAAPTERASFTEWLEGVRTEAVARGIRRDTVDAALATVEEPVPVVIERDRTQAEIVLPLETYLTRQLSKARIRTGREKMTANRALLDKVAEQYGVPARIIAGIWGMESNYGRFSGVRPTVSALATLAWDPRRAAYFRGELFNALQILDAGDVDLPRLKGSWAGALGQPQFMPSSYLQYAQDFDGDGRRDIWQSTGDVFASIANYLQGHGWVWGLPWGREVQVPADVARTIATTIPRRTGSCSARRDMTVALPLAEWRTLGVTLVGGAPLPKADVHASLVAGTTRFFLAYPNYDALLEYNCAHAYALGVALLGDQIAVPARPSSARRAPARTPTRQPSSRPRAKR